MQLCCKDGWLIGVRRYPSPNFNPRPLNTPVDLLVVHNISLPPGEFGGGAIDALFMNQLDADAHPYYAQIHTLRVSAHVMINREGGVTQYVSFQDSAWHAGASAWLGRARCNDFSIGIELEGTDIVPYTPLQYDRLVAVTKVLLQHYPDITLDRIVGHMDIAPERKTDPGPAFDWAYFRSRLLSSSM